MNSAGCRRGSPVSLAWAGGALACLALVSTIALPPAPRLVWNASASVPAGLYAVTPGAPVGTGGMVIASPPGRYRALAARRRYLPAGVPLVKRVAAAQGTRVCARGSRIQIDGRLFVTRRHRDASGHILPWWEGCRTLGHDDLFLLGDDPASFDSRYFGPVARSTIVGRAWPLWTR